MSVFFFQRADSRIVTLLFQDLNVDSSCTTNTSVSCSAVTGASTDAVTNVSCSAVTGAGTDTVTDTTTKLGDTQIAWIVGGSVTGLVVVCATAVVVVVICISVTINKRKR